MPLSDNGLFPVKANLFKFHFHTWIGLQREYFICIGIINKTVYIFCDSEDDKSNYLDEALHIHSEDIKSCVLLIFY